MRKKLEEGYWFAGLAFFILVVLKLSGVMTWSWWFILSPIWLPIILVSMFVFGCWLIIKILDYLDNV